ncbi:MAG: choice-of-anchor D domain-containing protein [Myxococcota bacterium]
MLQTLPAGWWPATIPGVRAPSTFPWLVAAALTSWLAPGCGCEDPTLSRTTRLLTPSQERVEFGDTYAGSTRERQVTLRSSGTDAVTIRVIRLEGSAAFSVVSGQARELPAGEAETLTLRFAPLVESTEAATLVVENNSDNASSIRVALDGTGTALPPCDDGNPCTDDSWNLSREQCVHDHNTHPCDDGSVCTVDDACVEGGCHGRFITCDDGDPCTRDLCNPATGCTAVTDPLACDDDNPCTADACDPTGGCSHDWVVNGTPCGTLEGCVRFPLCVDGVCTDFPVPDGSPCSDGNLCTADDQCVGGVCVGERTEREPAVVSELRSFGSRVSRALVLPDDRILVVDPAGFPSSSSSVHFAELGSADLTLVGRIAGELRPLGHLRLPDGNDVTLHPFSADAAVVWTFFGLTYVQWAADGTLTRRGTIALDEFLDRSSAAAPPIFFTTSNDGVRRVDWSNPDAPVELPPITSISTVSSLTLDEERSRLIFNANGVATVDITNPLEPGPLVDQPGVTLGFRAFADGDLLVAARSNCCPFEFLAVLDPDDFSNRAVLNVRPDMGRFAAFAGHLIHIEDTSGVAGSQRVLRVTDLRDPTSPVVRQTVPLPRDHVGDLRDLLNVNGSTLAVGGTGDSPARFYDFTPTRDPPLRALTGPAHGALQTLVLQPTGVVALDAHGVHVVDLGNPDEPQWLAGAMLPSAAGLFKLGTTTTTPVILSLTERGARFGPLSSPLLVMDVSQAQQPQPHASVQLSPVPGVVDGDGRWLYRLGEGTLEVRDLATLAPGFDQPSPPVATFPLPLCNSNNRPTLALSDDGRDLAINALFIDEGCGAGNGVPYRLIVVDVTAPLIPRVRARGDVAGQTTGLAVSGSRVVAVVGQVDPWGVATWSGQELLAFDVVDGSPEGSLVAHGPLVLPEQSHGVLAFDGQTAFVSTRTGVAVVNAAAQSPTLLAHVPLAQPPLSAVAVGGKMFFNGSSVVSVVEPPCPP